jgi:GNAT superfamily N-acetyltransferase
MIKKLSFKDSDAINQIINLAACAYDGKIPHDCFHLPYMPLEELQREMEAMTFYGWEQEGNLIGVMGFQPVKDVTLIRHAYILPEYQGKGIGGKLFRHLRDKTQTEYLLVGTWTDASWAVNFYLKQGFQFMPDKDSLLKKYWDISERQIETSIVLGMKVKDNG